MLIGPERNQSSTSDCYYQSVPYSYGKVCKCLFWHVRGCEVPLVGTLCSSTGLTTTCQLPFAISPWLRGVRHLQWEVLGKRIEDTK